MTLKPSGIVDMSVSKITTCYFLSRKLDAARRFLPDCASYKAVPQKIEVSVYYDTLRQFLDFPQEVRHFDPGFFIIEFSLC